jgi:hypothetical protein
MTEDLPLFIVGADPATANELGTTGALLNKIGSAKVGNFAIGNYPEYFHELEINTVTSCSVVIVLTSIQESTATIEAYKDNTFIIGETGIGSGSALGTNHLQYSTSLASQYTTNISSAAYLVQTISLDSVEDCATITSSSLDGSITSQYSAYCDNSSYLFGSLSTAHDLVVNGVTTNICGIASNYLTSTVTVSYVALSIYTDSTEDIEIVTESDLLGSIASNYDCSTVTVSDVTYSITSSHDTLTSTVLDYTASISSSYELSASTEAYLVGSISTDYTCTTITTTEIIPNISGHVGEFLIHADTICDITSSIATRYDTSLGTVTSITASIAADYDTHAHTESELLVSLAAYTESEAHSETYEIPHVYGAHRKAIGLMGTYSSEVVTLTTVQTAKTSSSSASTLSVTIQPLPVTINSGSSATLDKIYAAVATIEESKVVAITDNINNVIGFVQGSTSGANSSTETATTVCTSTNTSSTASMEHMPLWGMLTVYTTESTATSTASSVTPITPTLTKPSVVVTLGVVRKVYKIKFVSAEGSSSSGTTITSSIGTAAYGLDNSGTANITSSVSIITNSTSTSETKDVNIARSVSTTVSSATSYTEDVPKVHMVFFAKPITKLTSAEVEFIYPALGLFENEEVGSTANMLDSQVFVTMTTALDSDNYTKAYDVPKAYGIIGAYAHNNIVELSTNNFTFVDDLQNTTLSITKFREVEGRDSTAEVVTTLASTYDTSSDSILDSITSMRFEGPASTELTCDAVDSSPKVLVTCSSASSTAQDVANTLILDFIYSSPKIRTWVLPATNRTFKV